MIRKDTSNSKGLGRLSPRALSLFLMLVPHYSAFGKMNGDPMFIKSEVVPLVPWLTLPAIRKALQEINRETNVKWFEAEGRRYLHSLKWDEHQDLRTDRRGRDLIPSYPGQVRDKSGSSPGVVPPEVEVEVEGEGKEEVEVEVQKTADASAGASRPPLARHQGKGNGNGQGVGEGNTPDEIKIRKAHVKEAAVRNARAQVECNMWTFEKAVEKLVSAYGFAPQDARAALGQAAN